MRFVTGPEPRWTAGLAEAVVDWMCLPSVNAPIETMSDVRVLIVDDEQPARKRLVDLVDRMEGMQVQQACADGRAAIEVILRTPPDIVLLDVQMPEIDGLDIVRLVGPDRMPVVVFVTAYDEYALRAFEVAAVDYLMKPFDDDRFAEAMGRAVEHVRYRSLDGLTEQLIDLIHLEADTGYPGAENPDTRSPDAESRRGRRNPGASRPREEPDASAAGGASRIAVQRRNEIRLVPVETVTYFEAQGSYVKIHTEEHDYLIRERMKSLEARLSASRFFRIHRSTIVNLDRVCALEPNEMGDVAARLDDGTRLRVSRSRRSALEVRLGI